MKLKLHELRKKRGLTQQQLADMVGISKTHVSEMESGKKNPSFPLMQQLARVFEVSVHQMIDDSDLADDVAALIDLFQQIPPEDRQAALKAIRGFVLAE